MKRIAIALAVALLLTACAEAPQKAEVPEKDLEASPVLVENGAPVVGKVETQEETVPALWQSVEDVTVFPFIDQELQEAYEVAREQIQAKMSGKEYSVLRLSFDPILTHHDCVQAYQSNTHPQWELEHYFANIITLSYFLELPEVETAEIPAQGSVCLMRESDRQLWQAEEITGFRSDSSAQLRDASELAVSFHDPITGYVQSDGTVMAFCREEETGNIVLQSGSFPWGVEKQPMKSEPYFAKNRPYSETDLYHEPGWIGGELQIQEGEDGQLGLYRNGEFLWPYFAATAAYRLTDHWIYYLDGISVNRIDYAGENRQCLYQGEAISDTFYVAQNTVFFICESEGQSGVYRLYAPDKNCELISAQIPVSLDNVGLEPPISNQEIVWSYMNPEFLQLAEDKQEEYREKYGELDKITYYGMLEREEKVYSQIQCYVNTLTQEYYELHSGWVYLQPERTEENIQKNGNAWWKDFQP